jgi:hypothetical protein
MRTANRVWAYPDPEQAVQEPVGVSPQLLPVQQVRE